MFNCKSLALVRKNIVYIYRCFTRQSMVYDISIVRENITVAKVNDIQSFYEFFFVFFSIRQHPLPQFFVFHPLFATIPFLWIHRRRVLRLTVSRLYPFSLRFSAIIFSHPGPRIFSIVSAFSSQQWLLDDSFSARNGCTRRASWPLFSTSFFRERVLINDRSRARDKSREQLHESFTARQRASDHRVVELESF